MIISGVENVAVIVITHEVWGEQVLTVVVRTAGTRATQAQIIDHARASIAGYKVPKSLECREEPWHLSGAMKDLKRALRDPHWQGQETKIRVVPFATDWRGCTRIESEF